MIALVTVAIGVSLIADRGRRVQEEISRAADGVVRIGVGGGRRTGRLHLLAVVLGNVRHIVG